MAPKTGKKKKKKEQLEAAAAEAPEPTSAASEKKREAAAVELPASTGAAVVVERSEDNFSASAVVFHTRGGDDKVAKVLVAIEERKVQASYIGLPQKGKVTQRMVLFPMGRREKKDKADSVETARREYVEETGDYGGLAKYLDFADFDGSAEGEAQPRTAETWTGRHNMAVFFAPARMIVLFCEVPAEAALADARAACGGVPLSLASATTPVPAAAASAPSSAGGDAKPPKKKRKKAEEDQMNQNGTKATYKVGRTDHLEPAWLDAAALRAAVVSGQRSPAVELLGEECRLFPTAASVFRLPEVQSWLGVAPAAVQAEGAAAAPSAAAEGGDGAQTAAAAGEASAEAKGHGEGAGA